MHNTVMTGHALAPTTRPETWYASIFLPSSSPLNWKMMLNRVATLTSWRPLNHLSHAHIVRVQASESGATERPNSVLSSDISARTAITHLLSIRDSARCKTAQKSSLSLLTFISKGYHRERLPTTWNRLRKSMYRNLLSSAGFGSIWNYWRNILKNIKLKSAISGTPMRWRVSSRKRTKSDILNGSGISWTQRPVTFLHVRLLRKGMSRMPGKHSRKPKTPPLPARTLSWLPG